MINGAGGVTSGFGAFAAVPNCQTSLMWEVSVTQRGHRERDPIDPFRTLKFPYRAQSIGEAPGRSRKAISRRAV